MGRDSYGAHRLRALLLWAVLLARNAVGVPSFVSRDFEESPVRICGNDVSRRVEKFGSLFVIVLWAYRAARNVETLLSTDFRFSFFPAIYHIYYIILIICVLYLRSVASNKMQ